MKFKKIGHDLCPSGIWSGNYKFTSNIVEIPDEKLKLAIIEDYEGNVVDDKHDYHKNVIQRITIDGNSWLVEKEGVRNETSKRGKQRV